MHAIEIGLSALVRLTIGTNRTASIRSPSTRPSVRFVIRHTDWLESSSSMGITTRRPTAS
jgi:hypothetical protein